VLDRFVQLGSQRALRGLFSVATFAAIVACTTYGSQSIDDERLDADGGSDAGNDGDLVPVDGASSDAGATGPFCETVGKDAQVCDDFETPGTFSGRWDETTQYLGTFDIVEGAGFAGSKGLRLTANPLGTGDNSAGVFLRYGSKATASYVDYEVAFKLNAIPSNATATAPIYLEFIGAPLVGRNAVGFYLDGADLSVAPTRFDENGTVVSDGVGKLIETVPIGTWRRVRIVADVAKQPPSLYVYLDDALKHERELTGFIPAPFQLYVGAGYAAAPDGGLVAYDLDDARVSWK
jgi:hypothetical protein